ncbi:hypothetical protein [Pseudomonas proteolytica]|uniref:hypothetical protein n=1 Tax=Pseudomonas proteolytica TaxID=219574 RepID=UPI00089B3496|nr:hypothetical protein [Pseudomonas proteolytica]KAA8702473.1 hypothetical protein F4W61_11690 [Pseudomonas proteolytica]TWR76228.1 hypothetical protein FIV38_23915 [Pseudomonas proteolytica]SEE80347.1 hypothetical protein SAMN04490200_5522 [Pseudomonas proteolytica]
MTDQAQRLEIATVRAEIGSNITYRFNNDAIDAGGIPTESGDIKNLKLIIKEIEDKASVSTSIYTSVAAGLAATSEGGMFLVQSDEDDEVYVVWRKVGGVAVDTGKRALSSQAAEDAVNAAQDSADAAEASALAAHESAINSARAVDSIAALKALDSSNIQRATVIGYYAKGDGGGGVYYADLTDTTTADNGGTVIVAADGARWKLATTDVVDIRQFGARNGSATSSSPQAQKAFDDGGTKSAADGVYLLGSTVSYDHSAVDFPHTGEPSKRLTFLGNSLGNTIFEVAAGLPVGFLLKGGILTRSQGGWGYSRFGRMTIVGKDRSMVPANRTGVGVHHRTIGYDHISDLSVQHMDTGILIQGCLSNEYTNIYLRENNIGMVVSRFAGETLPNAMNFSKVVATGCSTTAIYFDLMGAGNSWRDGSIEGNGTPGALNSFGFKANLLGDNGLACLEMDNVYFESNAGVADLDLDNVGSKPVVVVLKKCNFHRLSNSNFTTCNIRLRSSGGGKLTLILEGCGFLSGGDYAPSQSRPFIDEGADCHVIGWDTCTTSEVVSIGSAFNSASSARISGSATGGGTILNAPFNTFLTRINPGEYKMSTPGGYGSTKEGYVPSVIPIGLVADVRLAYITRNSANEFQFAFRGPSSTPYQDSDFTFTVDRSK